MTPNQQKINQLIEQLESLAKRQDEFAKEINDLKIEIYLLESTKNEPITEKETVEPEPPITNIDIETEREKVKLDYDYKQEEQERAETQKQPTTSFNKAPKTKSDIEKFIGENLISKIGIAITIIGVAIGTKYSIEYNLISPLTRIILGYLTGFVLLGLGIKLKKNYQSYSAVLVSGAMAIMYFITYSAYTFYNLIPQAVTFPLMIIFTVFTVLAAINYNRHVIAHIGLVGAYAVPFLLSDGSGKVAVLFVYMAIINIGILVIALQRYWKSLYYSSFGLTWLVYLAWYLVKYNADEHLGLALTFLAVFFIIFYAVFLGYKILKKEKFKIDDTILLLANSFIFYGIGYSIFSNEPAWEVFLGAFTLFNAILHFIVSLVVFRQKLPKKNLYYLVAGLVLVFITIAIPVQLKGHWITLLWAGEAALLFWIGRTKNVPVYEKLSYLLMLLAFFSIIHDWTMVNFVEPKTKVTPLLNINFLSSLLFIAAFAFINIINLKNNRISELVSHKKLAKIISFAIPTILLFTIYYTFVVEIEMYWNRLFQDSAININSNTEYPNYYWNYDLIKFKIIWVINYSLLFVALLAFLNHKRLKKPILGIINIVLIGLALFAFLTEGLFNLSELRESYLEQTMAQYYKIDIFYIVIRYISFVFVALALAAYYQYVRQNFIKRSLNMSFDFILYISVLWIASSELINWLEIAKSAESYKFGLSILWGIYSLLLIVLGIWKKKRHVRIGAIVLFSITLVKLVIYDISHLNNIAKTLVFVLLGVLLLIISFLYNKYKHIISDEDPENKEHTTE